MFEIFKISSASPIDFAAEELRKYLRMMMPRCGAIPITYDKEAKSGIRLGLMQDFGIDTSEADDTYLDDIIHIEKSNGSQIIAGSNPRSVLLAVYKFLKLNGCRWLFPGVDGEYIPIKDIEYIDYHKMADNRYRGQCNEGSTAQINYLDAIDFVPKIGMNVYMLEFDIPYGYYDNWYRHTCNEAIAPEPISENQILQWKRQCECEIQKRGLQFHDMGHGWTTTAFGINTTAHWKKDESVAIPEEMKEYIALVGGERKIHQGIPLNTNFCMSNPEARKLVIKTICDYAEKSNYVDFLHIWLADGKDNHCECEECKKMIPSDWYVILLNEIDEELTRRNLSTHIVFISYYDTAFPPLTQKIKNSKRFSMLFAPHTRVYTESYLEDSDPSKLLPYIRNHSIVPKGIGACMAYLEKWKEAYSGDVFCYEYHFWRQHEYDPSYQYIAKNIYDDIHGLKKHGLNGIIEDQTPRNFLPSGFPQVVYGEALFDLDVPFEEMEEDYFSHAFGENWKKVRDFLEDIKDIDIFSKLSDPPRNEKAKPIYVDPALAEHTQVWIKKCDAFKPTVDENQNSSIRCQQVLWRNLYLFLDIIKYDAMIFEGRFKDDPRKSYETYYKVMREIGAKELSVQKMFDLGLWGVTFQAFSNPYKMFVDIP